MKARIQDLDAVIGANIKSVRQLKKVSQKKLAEELGITFQQVQKYEKGLNRVSTVTLVKIADFMNVHPVSLLEGVYNTGETVQPLSALDKDSLDLLRIYSKISDTRMKAAIKDFIGSLAKK